MGCGKKASGRSAVIGAILIGFLVPFGCEKPKPTIGEQVGSAIDNSIQATDKAVQQSQEAVDQARKNISQNTLDLRNAVKQAVDEHLNSGDGK